MMETSLQAEAVLHLVLQGCVVYHCDSFLIVKSIPLATRRVTDVNGNGVCNSLKSQAGLALLANQ